MNRRTPFPPAAALLAGFLAVLTALAACTAPGTRRASDERDALAELRTEAALAPCPPPGPTPAVGEAVLPDRTLACLGGGPDVALRGLTGTPTVLNLWATWCGPCRQELPAFQQVHQRAGTAVRVLGVVTQDPGQTRPLAFLAELGLHFSNVIDDDGDVAREIGARGLPATLFVAGDGRVVHVYNGAPLTYDKLADLISTQLRVRLDG